MQIVRAVRNCWKSKNSAQLLNKAFSFIDACLSFLSLLILLFTGQRSTCLASFYLFWCLFFLGQMISHYLLIKIPKVDVIKFDKTIKRLVGIICFIQVCYLLLVVVFWQKSDLHPLYCALCEYYNLPFIIGLVFVIHLIVTAGIVVALIHLFVTRKYYLIALGGFQVEQRLAIQRQEALRRIGLLQPNYAYPIDASIKSNKYYKFQDVVQPGIINQDVCSICLNKKVETQNIVRTKCNHFFHRSCVQTWATVDSRCPDCRSQFQLDHSQRKQLIKQNEKKLDVVHEQQLEQQSNN